MDGYDIKYEIKRFQNRKTAYDLSCASQITQAIVSELKKNKITGIYDKVFYRYEKCEVYIGKQLAKTSKDLSERIVIMPKIANNNPFCKHNINIYVDIASGVMIVCFGKTAQGFIHHNDINSHYFKDVQLPQLIEAITDLQSKEYCSISTYLGVGRKYLAERFEPNYTKEEINKYLKPSIDKYLKDYEKNYETVKTKVYTEKNVWEDKTTHIYKLY